MKSNYAFNIQINNEIKPVQDFSLAASNMHYSAHNVVDTSQYQLRYKLSVDNIYVDIPDNYNLYTYLSKEHFIKEYVDGYLMNVLSYHDVTIRLMNLVATGHAMILVTSDSNEYSIGTPSLRNTDIYINQQLDYITQKYKRVTDPFYAQYIVDSYLTIDAAKSYFNSPDWAIRQQKAERYTTLNNLFRDTLMDIAQDKAAQIETLNNIQREANILSLSNMLELKLPTIHSYDLIPNQDTSAPMSFKINYQVKFEAEQLGSKKEYGAAYFTPGNRLFVSETDLMEQAAINAYYYADPVLRVPTELELEAEYEALLQEYEDLKELAKVNPFKATLKARRWNKNGHYERFLELYDHFNTVLHSMLQG